MNKKDTKNIWRLKNTNMKKKERKKKESRREEGSERTKSKYLESLQDDIKEDC